MDYFQIDFLTTIFSYDLEMLKGLKIAQYIHVVFRNRHLKFFNGRISRAFEYVLVRYWLEFEW